MAVPGVPLHGVADAISRNGSRYDVAGLIPWDDSRNFNARGFPAMAYQLPEWTKRSGTNRQPSMPIAPAPDVEQVATSKNGKIDPMATRTAELTTANQNGGTLGASGLLALRMNDLVRVTGLSRRFIERERSAGRFPAPDRVAGKVPLWKVSTVESWLSGN